mmetsp:Transcript_45916/g.70250  ORF Transcript_45916/g.70250 Transcript_45916/m.70250 type:complete len:241 (+) Transcript_45916:704-1426(+)
MQIGDSELVIFLVELPENGIQALRGVVDRSGVGRVQDVRFTSSRKDDINVSLRNLASRSSVSVDSHGSQMHNVNIKFTVKYSTAQIVGTTNVVIDGVSLALGVFHGIGSSALFGEVDDRVRLFFLQELNQQIVILGNVKVDKLDVFSANFLPGCTTLLRTGNGGQRVTSQVKIDLPARQVVHNNNIVSLITQVEGGRPTTETITSQYNHFLLLGFTIGTILGVQSGLGQPNWSGLGDRKG